MSYFEKSCSSAKTIKFILRSPYQASPSLQNYKPSAAPINSTLFFFLDSPKGHTKRSAWKCLLLCEACLVADYDVDFLIHQTCSFTLNKSTQARCLQNPLPLLLNLITPLLPFSASNPTRCLQVHYTPSLQYFKPSTMNSIIFFSLNTPLGQFKRVA